MKKHLVFVDREKWDRNLLMRSFPSYRLTFLEKLGQFEKIKDAEIISVFVNTKVSKEAIQKLPNLKFIATRSTGFDHIDLKACQERGIKVANVPTYGENTVAEHAFGLILNLSRKITQAIDRTRAGDFTIGGLMGFDLKGKTIGIIGAGNIGRHVIKMALGFEMKVLVADPSVTSAEVKKLGATKVELKKLLAQSDIVTLHCPLCAPTSGMINASAIKQMKKGSLLINTARGELMDTTAVLAGLKTGILAGVGLDAVEGEQALKNQATSLSKQDLRLIMENRLLIKQPNVIVTPHIAFNSREAVARIVNTTIENIKSYLSGKSKNLVSSGRR
ncbi:MAG: NAD(P)-dependent oxidoreductase [Candidatus Komeilibacteria bacterium]|nr:NAD(P)-dependent oxidoreductase [Candidatus Komeilibacteria bacterium]